MGRYHDFDSQFRLKKDHEPQKLKLIKAAMRGKLDELIPNSMEKFRVKVIEQSEHPFPEMKQVTTAFIMISVKPELEKEIVDKLYAYEEVKELHYVPVDFDVIAKIVLERDLLSSESEVVRQFVQGKVRRIPGVTWTQTIIALSSKIKTG